LIFVTVGASDVPFDRLLRAVAPLAAEHELIVQHGASSIRPPRARCITTLEFDALLDHMRQAWTIVSHCGAGSVLSALSVGKRPVVLPRLRRLGEAVDDHQLELARRLARAELVTLVEDESLLPEFATKAPGVLERPNAGESALAHELREYLHELVGDRHDCPFG